MIRTTTRTVIAVLSTSILAAAFLTSSAGAGNAAEPKARALALLPTKSSISAEMSSRAVALPIDEFAPTTELPSVHFDFASATIRPADRKVLDTNAEWLKANRERPVAIAGAADPRGSGNYNLSLGERRARAVRDYLVARGVRPERITIVSLGEGQQVCRGGDCWALDRRVDFLVKKLPYQAP